MTERVALFVPCLVEQLYPRSAIATVKLLEYLGCTVDFPPEQTCCGQPFYNSGYQAEAGQLAERMMTVFSEHSLIITPSGSCAAMARAHFGHCVAPQRQDDATAFGARVLELSEYLVHRRHVDFSSYQARWNGTVTYHASCHLRDLGITDETPQLLAQIAGLTLELPERSEQCCGFGGTFMAKYADISGEMARDKVACLSATKADALLISDAGCAMNLEGVARRTHWKPRLLSLAEILAESVGVIERPAGGLCNERES